MSSTTEPTFKVQVQVINHHANTHEVLVNKGSEGVIRVEFKERRPTKQDFANIWSNFGRFRRFRLLGRMRKQ